MKQHRRKLFGFEIVYGITVNFQDAQNDDIVNFCAGYIDIVIIYTFK